MHIDKNRLPWNCGSACIIVCLAAIFFFEYFVFTFIFLKNLAAFKLEIVIFIFLEMHLFITLMVWSYIKVVKTGPGYISSSINDQFPNAERIKERQKQFMKIKFSQPHFGAPRTEDPAQDKVDDPEALEDLEKLKKIANDPILSLTELGYCFRCDQVKIPRTHHCRQCNKCVYRMDHHCPWIGNCVGFYNHKYFVLFLCYAAVCLFQVFFWELIFFLLDNSEFSKVLSIESQTVIQINCMSCMALSLAVTFLGGLHIYMARTNTTTVEFHIRDILQRNPFNKGVSRNVEEVFGTDRSTWILPVTPRLRKEDESVLLQDIESGTNHKSLFND